MRPTIYGNEVPRIVTIGMPVYNGITYIEHALCALSDQTFGNYELVVSDNASTDGTWEILEKWAAGDDRIILHRQPDLVDVQVNFQYVLDQARTEYFMWHACNDWMAPNYLEELIGVMNTEPGCALACGSAFHVSGTGDVIRQIPFPAIGPGSRIGRVRRLLKAVESTWIYGLFRTTNLRRAQAISEEFGYVWGNDFVTLLPFVLNDQLRGTNRTAFYYRRSQTSQNTYAPKTPSQRLHYGMRYLRCHVLSFAESGLSPTEKLLGWPWLLAHFFKTTGWMIKRPLLRAIKSPMKYLCKIVAGNADRRIR